MNSCALLSRCFPLVFLALGSCNACANRYYCFTETGQAEVPFAGGTVASVYRENVDDHLLTYGARITVYPGAWTGRPSQEVALAVPEGLAPISATRVRFRRRQGLVGASFALIVTLADGASVRLVKNVDSSVQARVSEGTLARPHGVLGLYPRNYCISAVRNDRISITIALANFLPVGASQPPDPLPATPDDVFGCPL
jgi:hypothetical protein